MAKFVIVNTAPQKLKKDEIVISTPNFLKAVQASNRKATGKKVTALNHLRQILTNIAEEYPESGLNEYTSVPLNKYEGLPFDTDEDLCNIVIRMLSKHHPTIVKTVIEREVKNRPLTTKLIYFVGNEDNADVFLKNGLAPAGSKEGGDEDDGN